MEWMIKTVDSQSFLSDVELSATMAQMIATFG